LASGSHEDMWNAIEVLERNPLVEYAEPNRIGQALITPNDSYFRWLD